MPRHRKYVVTDTRKNEWKWQMRTRLTWRRVHYWLSLITAIPVLIITVTGLILHLKKDFHWIQPDEQRGTEGAPQISFDQLLAACRNVPQAQVDGWNDIARVDLDPDDALLKVVTRDDWEIQVNAVDGEVLQVARRRSDLLEALHDGSWFGSTAQRCIFLPTGAMLLVLWGTGVYLLVVPYLGRRTSR